MQLKVKILKLFMKVLVMRDDKFMFFMSFFISLDPFKRDQILVKIVQIDSLGISVFF